jgi:hypothetical protein
VAACTLALSTISMLLLAVGHAAAAATVAKQKVLHKTLINGIEKVLWKVFVVGFSTVQQTFYLQTTISKPL